MALHRPLVPFPGPQMSFTGVLLLELGFVTPKGTKRIDKAMACPSIFHYYLEALMEAERRKAVGGQTTLVRLYNFDHFLSNEAKICFGFHPFFGSEFQVTLRRAWHDIFVLIFSSNRRGLPLQQKGTIDTKSN